MRTLLVAFTGGIVGTVFTSMMVLAWSGPTSAPPNGNVSAPVNVGTTDQVKDAGLALNSLAVFGNAILAGASSYLNFGATAGSSGYGIRDNAGTIELKNSGGSWASLGAGGRIPGEVAAFSLSSCPAGWSPLMTAAGRVIVGVGDNGTNTYTLGSSGGADSRTLTIAQLPPHSFTYTDIYPGGSFSWTGWGGGQSSNVSGEPADEHPRHWGSRRCTPGISRAPVLPEELNGASSTSPNPSRRRNSSRPTGPSRAWLPSSSAPSNPTAARCVTLATNSARC